VLLSAALLLILTEVLGLPFFLSDIYLAGGFALSRWFASII
jgi:hypothetical protein